MADQPAARSGEQPVLRSGAGRVLTFFYGLLALAATGRSAYQLIAMFHRAPTAYVLSGVAALIYVLALVAFVVDARRVAFIACSVELAGVVVVGSLSIVRSADFPDATVWSDYGSGYGGLPLVLPVLALIFLYRRSRH